MTSNFTTKVIPKISDSFLAQHPTSTSNQSRAHHATRAQLEHIPNPQKRNSSSKQPHIHIMSPLRSALSTASRSLLSIRQFALTSFRQNNHASTSPFTQLRKFSALMNQGRWGDLLRSKIAGGNAKQLSSTYVFSQASGMKTRSSVKRLCDGCKVSTLG